MKKILIIGGTGFLGFHLAKLCLKRNYKVYSLSRNKPKKKRFLLNVIYIYADISKKRELNLKLNSLKNINYVVNFGGEVNHKKLKKTYLSHFYGVKNISDILLKKNIEKFIQVGSSLEYGNYKSPQKETSNLKPSSNYSKAKAKSSKLLLSLFKKKNFPVTIVRPYQVYGPYQDLNRFIPIVINSCLKNEKFPCSEGLQSRDFLYIDAFVNSILKLILKKEAVGETFNIGYGTPKQIKEIIKLIQKKIGKGYPEFGKIRLRDDENLITYPNIKKTKKLLGWKPKFDFKSGLYKTINFYKRNNI